MSAPPREHLPDTRNARAATLYMDAPGARVELTVRVGLYPDGRVGELFIDCGQHGETVRGLLDQWAIAVSVGLQCGVPLEVYARKARHTRFAPWGRGTIPGDDRPHEATSVIDMIARYLERFCEKEKMS